MPYLSMCVNEFQEYKEGTFYITYHDTKGLKEMIGLCPASEVGEKLDSYSYLDFELFRSHFENLMYFATIKIRKKKEKTKFIEKLFEKYVEPKYRDKYLSFRIEDFRMTDFQNLCKRVLMPLFKLEIIDNDRSSNILGEFSGVLEYTFDTINTFYKNKDLVNYELAVEKASLLSEEIYNYALPILKMEKDSINYTKGQELKRLESTYSKFMDTYINELKNINKSGGCIKGCSNIE